MKNHLTIVVLFSFWLSCTPDSPKEQIIAGPLERDDTVNRNEFSQIENELLLQKEKIRIFPEKEMMEATGITLQELEKTLSAGNLKTGNITGKGELEVKSELKNVEEVKYIVVRSTGNETVMLGDVADIFSGVTDEEIEYRKKKYGYFEMIKTDSGTYRFIPK
ncbi:MAG: efflux RND transporter permease subunit [Bacteroidota bacterium]